MARKRKDIQENLLTLVEKEARATLKMSGITIAERLKAIELIAKVALVRHKIRDGGGDAGSFFAPQ